jgi:cytoskeleton protein RodZ
MSSERAEQPAAPEVHRNELPGKTLAAQREAMGWAVEQVADQLKLAVRQVVALEADDYSALPSRAVVRGFVRAYAKILKLDPAPLVAMIEMETTPPIDTAAVAARREKPATFSESRFPSHGKRRSLPLGWIAVAVAAVAATAVAWHLGMLLVPGQNSDDAAHDSAASMTELVPPASVSAHASGAAQHDTLQNSSVPLISVPSQAAEAGHVGAAAPEAPANTSPAAPPAAAPALANGPAAAPTVALPTVANVPAAAPAAAGPNPLVIDVRADSWIEVRPAKGGAALISRLVKGGSTETVQVNEPVNLIVGNPPGVSATLRGAAVELPVAPGKQIARVSLK